MKSKLLMAGIVLILTILFVPRLYAEGKFSGYAFGDYYWFAGNHSEANKDQNGFVIRRIYLTYDVDLKDRFTSRLRLEMSQSDFTKTSAKMEAVVKDAYLKWKHPLHSVYLGLSGTPTWGLVEKHWGYRSVEKSPMDLQKFGGSRDTGLSVKGSFDEGKVFSYHAMVGNGASNSNEDDRNKKAYLSLTVKPAKSVVFQVYGDYANNKDGTDANTSEYTLQAFLGLNCPHGRAGLLIAQNTQEMGVAAKDRKIEIYSAYAVAKLADRLSVFARVDQLSDPNPSAAGIAYIPMVATARTTLAIFGFDIKAGEKVRIQPNIETVFYSHDRVTGSLPNRDAIPRITVFYTF